MTVRGVVVSLLLPAALCMAGCDAPLSCDTTAVLERVSVKLDRELRENPRFLAPHLPDRSSLTIGGIGQEGVVDGALACTARLAATLATPAGSSELQRIVHFTAHRDGWDTYVEVVSLDTPRNRATARTEKAEAP